jgi:orotate phosphoribosyltransferase
MYRRRVDHTDRTDLARRIYDAAHLTGTFTLRSGVVSHEYFDKYRFESDPQLLSDIAASCAALVPYGMDALAGLELGGVPLATMISQATRLPAVYVRKEAKTYGTCQLAEGGEIDGRRLCIIEDVVTSGGAILDAASELRARGARLGPVICVIDRESGGREKLAADDLELFPLYTMSELSAAAAGA